MGILIIVRAYDRGKRMRFRWVVAPVFTLACGSSSLQPAPPSEPRTTPEIGARGVVHESAIANDLESRLAGQHSTPGPSRWSVPTPRALFGFVQAGHNASVTARVALTEDKLVCFWRYSILFAPTRFAVGTARPESTDWLNELAKRPPSLLHVQAHAAPNEPSPLALSTARANAIADVLVKDGVPRSSLVLHPYGSTYSAILADDDDVARAVVSLDDVVRDTSEIHELAVDRRTSDWLAAAIAALPPSQADMGRSLHAPRACFDVPQKACADVYTKDAWSQLSASLLRLAENQCEVRP
jgi:hypothetical protein